MINNIFQFIQDKKGKPIPLKYKLLNNIPLTKNDITYDGNLSLYNSNITYLPDNLTINGWLNLYKSKIKSLPNNLTVNSWLNINHANISDLPEELIINGDLYCINTPLAYKIKNDSSLLKKLKKQIKGNIYYDYY